MKPEDLPEFAALMEAKDVVRCWSWLNGAKPAPEFVRVELDRRLQAYLAAKGELEAQANDS